MEKLKYLIIFIGLFSFSSCSKIHNFENKLNELSERVENLEKDVQKVNEAAIAINKLVQQKILILDYVQEKYGYKLNLSDGSTVNVVYGQQAPCIVPIVGINKNGEWIVSFDGKKFSPIEGAENAFKNSGSTPQMKIDADGYWMYSLNNGQSWEFLLGENDKKVSAINGKEVASYSSFFKSVEVDEEGNFMIIKLLNGDVLKIGIISDFYISFTNYKEATKVHLNQHISIKTEQKDVVSAMIQNCPKGWNVELTDTHLNIYTGTSAEPGIKSFELIVISSKNFIRQYKLKFEQLSSSINDDNCKIFIDFVSNNDENVLVDFSYAGYMRGEIEAPKIETLGYKVYNVTDYGAVPNDGKSDRSAFLKCLEAALGVPYISSATTLTFESKEKANVIIYFPEGEFILHSKDDDVNGKSQTIQVRSGNFVLKGAGRDKTTIVMQDPNLPNDPSILYSSPGMFEIKHNSGLSDITNVTSDASKGSFSVEVASVSGLSAGAWVCLSVENNDPEFIAQELSPYTLESTMTDIKNNGVRVYDYHQIKSISGATVTFYEPIMHEVEAKWNWKIKKYPHYENVGIEDICFKGFAKADFVHHGSWEDDGAYKPVNMVRLTNSWMRRLRFESVSEAASITNCTGISAYDIVFEGNRGHSAIRSQASTRVFMGATLDKASGAMVKDYQTYMEGAGQYHAVGVSKQSIGTVLWRNRWGDDSCFEAHATQPRATLIDCCMGGWMKYRQGGDQNQLPNHLDDLVIWNFNATTAQTKIFNWWETTSIWWRMLPPVVVGFHGESCSFDSNQTKCIFSNGIPVNPESLYEAQMKERLGYVPAWLTNLK